VKVVYVRNPHGVVSAVPEPLARELLQLPGWDEVSREEGGASSEAQAPQASQPPHEEPRRKRR